MGGFSGRSSRKGSSCSTPVSAMRTEMEYPSPNFIRPNLSQCPGVSVDESTKLTIRLHYNPVMDEWLSLSDEIIEPRKGDESDILFDLLKEELEEVDVEVIKIGAFLEAMKHTGLRQTDQRLAKMMKKFQRLVRDKGAENLTKLQLEREPFKE